MRSLAAGLLASIVFFALPAAAADSLKVWVSLRDKGPLGASPETSSAAASTPAAARAWEDAPVHAPHLEALKAAGLRLSVALKWQNKVSGWVDRASLPALRALPCVRAVEALPRKAPAAPSPPLPRAAAAPLAKNAAVSVFGIFDSVFIRSGAGALRDTVAARGLRAGEGLKVAVMDEDFHLGHQAFDSLFASGRIADQWDFVAGTAVAADRQFRFSHGAMVLSPMAAHAPGLAVGLAPHARYLLYRTENASLEDRVEEDYLAAAFERAVDSGAQVINVSLGYRYDFDTLPNTPFSQMNGRTRPASLAALGAARRGALVVVAMGNEAPFQPSPSITSPADADSIVSVGMINPAVNPSVGGWCTYSSTGNTFDGRLKPEISALGCGVPVIHPSTPAGTTTETGTSVGAPVIAGVAALLRQLHPAKDAQAIRAALTATGSRALDPDSLVGHGLVRAKQAHCALLLDSLAQTPCPDPVPAPSPRAVKSMFVWRGGDVVPLPWADGLDLTRPRLWDLKGRPHKVETFRDENGGVQMRSRSRIAPGSYLLRIPKAPADSTVP